MFSMLLRLNNTLSLRLLSTASVKYCVSQIDTAQIYVCIYICLYFLPQIIAGGTETSIYLFILPTNKTTCS